MIKRVITYIDYDGVERTETVIFKTDDDNRYIAPDGTVWVTREEYLDYVRGE